MKPTLTQILGISLAVSFSIGALSFLSGQSGRGTLHVSDFLFMSGLAMMGIAGLNLLIGIILLIVGKTEPGKNFLACGGILLVIGFSTCFGGFITMSGI